MNNWATQAVEKLRKEKKNVTGKHETVMVHAVAAQLEAFCIQDEEFAQAVVQGGTLGNCMRRVAAGVGNALSDLEAYKRAVQFYFPGAEVNMQLTIDLIGKATEKPEKPVAASNEAKVEQKVISLNLADFFT